MILRTAYAQDLSAKVAAGDRVCLRLRLQALVDDAWTASDLTGRVFVQRLVDRSGAEILRVDGGAGSDAAGDFVDFVISGDQTLLLLPAGKAARDLEHAIQEVVSPTETDTVVWPRPFGIRRITTDPSPPDDPGDSGAPLLDLTVRRGPEADQFILRYAGQAGRSYLQALIGQGVLSAGATDADFAAWLLLQTETASMATKFFAVETDALGAASTFHSAWRDSGVAAGALTVIGSFQALVASDQPVDAWIEYSDDGAAVLGGSEEATIGAASGAVPLSLPLCARYARVAVSNPGGGPANISIKAAFGR